MRLIFIESSFPAFLSKYTQANIFFYTPESKRYSMPGQTKVIVPRFLFKYIKFFFSITPFSCIYQGGFGIVFNSYKKKRIISDGILTEWLVRQGYIQPDEFISVENIKSEIPVQNSDEVILGNNFFEFGNFTFETYQAYLLFLKTTYPNALYFPHPRETSDLPSKIFKEKLIETSDNIETYYRKRGEMPGCLIGFIGSTAIASLGKLAIGTINIESIIVDDCCDGKLQNVTDPYLLKTKNIKITFKILSDTVKQILSSSENIRISEHKLFL
ncbi:MAG: hypothetical protein HYU70_10100 [Bacteroidetes bacterium]|nr:hypothetical protein [Bacteroidota bacterium]